MKVTIYKDYEALSEAAAAIMINAIKQKPAAVLCLASGHTPLLTCQLFVKKVVAEKINLSQVTILSLDEWVGVTPENKGSCHHFFYTTVFNPLQLSPNQFHVFNALADDLQNECAKMDTIIADRGGIDLMIVGIGMNGHIGFNEPGVSFTNYSHVIDLDETTIAIGQKYFTEATTISKGITIGLQHLMNAKEVLLLANGSKKAGVVKQTIEGPVTKNFPASIMQQHSNGSILIDEEAASLLNHN
jgi:galactosamine-6-phosphate isomerase